MPAVKLVASESRHFFAIVLTLIVILGAMLRLQAVIYTEVDSPIRADAAQYFLCAYNLKFFGVYTHSDTGVRGNPSALKPEAFRTPGFPLFLMPFLDRDIGKTNYYGILLSQALLSTLTILLAYFLFAAIGGRVCGLLTAALTALSPHLINMNVYLLTETLFCFFLVAAVTTLAHEKTLKSPWLLLLTGMLLGAATLTRPWIQGYALILFLFLWFPQKQVPPRHAVFLLLGLSLLLSPWLLRNQLSIGMLSDPLPSITSIYHGSFPNMMLNDRPETLGFAYHFDPRAGELSSSSTLLWQDLAARFHASPWVYIQWYGIGKTAAVFSWSILGGVGDVFQYPVLKTPFERLFHFRVIHELMQWLHIPITIAGLSACVLVWLPRKRLPFSEQGIFLARCIALLFFYFIIVHMIYAPYSRYAIPMRPLLYGMAVIGMSVGVGLIRKKMHSLTIGKDK